MNKKLIDVQRNKNVTYSLGKTLHTNIPQEDTDVGISSCDKYSKTFLKDGQNE